MLKNKIKTSVIKSKITDSRAAREVIATLRFWLVL